MDHHLLSLNPEARASRMQALLRTPWLLYRLLRWRMLRGGWLMRHLREHRRFDRRAFAEDQPIDVLVLCSDHFEPARRYGDAAAIESVQTWCAAYEEMADRHRDSDGRPPQHTWFYRYDYPNAGCVQTLTESVFRGFGEIEFHLHHGHDTHETMLATLQSGLDWFNRFGAMRTAEANPQQRFGYVAGNSALDNGAGDDALSGCPTEIRALRDTGCYADFTFPSLGSPAQPRLTNSIYYAREDGGPKSYDCGTLVRACGVASAPRGAESATSDAHELGDLMIFQGPIAIDWRLGCLDDGALENSSPPHTRRLANWLSAHVHVPGRPEWVFVKLHTHAMQNRASYLSPANDALFTAMETWWNRPPFRLHYVTAREAYNIVKAAEAGHSGNPNDYRDFEIPPPANRLFRCSTPWRLLSYTPQRTHIEILECRPTRLDFAHGSVAAITGRFREVEATYRGEELINLRIEGEGPYQVQNAECRMQNERTSILA